MVAILQDKKYINSLWCKNIYSGLTKRLREKRIPFCEIYDSCPNDIEAVFIIGSDLIWTSTTIRSLNRGGIVPILICNIAENLPGCIYNCVSSDINASMKHILDTLSVRKKRKIAVYGVNTDSISDIGRTDSLLFWRFNSFDSFLLFENKGSLDECFKRFYPNINTFDAVICTNDFAAISLVKHLEEIAPEQLDRLQITCCTTSELSKSYKDIIISLDTHYEQYGKAAVYIYEALQKHCYLSGITVQVSWDIEERSTEISDSPININDVHSSDTFYEDPELNDMLVVDRLLTLSDETDKKILCLLMQNYSYEKISEICFLSINAIKYRIKKLAQNSNAINKNNMIDLAKKYIHNI